MANKKNKVKFNIRNVHYALLTKSDDGEVTYPFRLIQTESQVYSMQTDMHITRSITIRAMKVTLNLLWCRSRSVPMY